MTPLIGNVPLTLKSRLTIAFVIVDEVLTGSVVETRFGQTLIILRAAVAPRVAGLAPALVAARFVAADAEVTHILLRRQVQPVTFPALPSLAPNMCPKHMSLKQMSVSWKYMYMSKKSMCTPRKQIPKSI